MYRKVEKDGVLRFGFLKYRSDKLMPYVNMQVYGFYDKLAEKHRIYTDETRKILIVFGLELVPALYSYLEIV